MGAAHTRVRQKFDFATDWFGSWTWDIPQDSMSFQSFSKISQQPHANTFSDFLNLVHPDDRDYVRTEIRLAMEDRSDYRIEFRLLLPDGRVVWLGSKGSVRRDVDNNPIQMYGISVDITRWKTAEAALQRSEREFSTLVDSLDGIVWVADARTFQFSFVSHRAEKMLGYPLQEWLTNPNFWRDHVHPDDLEWCSTFCMQAIAEGRDHESEYRMLAADGRTVWVHDIATVQREDDVSTEMRGIMLDVTARKQAEAALAASERRFRLVFEKSAAGMIITDSLGAFLHANPAFCEFVGRSLDELKQLGVRDITQPTDACTKYFDEVRRGERDTVDIDKKYVRKNGDIVWGRSTAVVVSSGASRDQIVAVIQDVTPQKRAEAILRESEERFRIVANDTPAYLWMTSVDQNLVFVNRKLAEFLGTKQTGSEDEWAAFIHPDDAERVLNKFRECRAAGSEYQSELRLRRFDGVYRLISGQAVPRRSPSGEFLGYAGSMLDITELKQAEQQLLTAHDQLARELNERRHAEAEILALSERLINTNEEIQGRLARELHDDIGQQVAAVSISVSNLKRQIPEEIMEARKQCAQVQHTLFDLAENIRHLSHELHPAVLEHSGIQAALEGYCREFSALSGVRVSLEARDALENIPRVAALCMYRVAQEALQNVLRHARVQEAAVELERGQGCARLSILDRGVGFDVNGAAASGGLGLLSMKERARLVGATLEIQSVPNQGTLVKLTIPLSPG